MNTPPLKIVRQLHRKYHGKRTTAVNTRKGKRPDAIARLSAIGLGMEWNRDAREGYEATAPYEGSKTQREHRGNQQTTETALCYDYFSLGADDGLSCDLPVRHPWTQPHGATDEIRYSSGQIVYRRVTWTRLVDTPPAKPVE